MVESQEQSFVIQTKQNKKNRASRFCLSWLRLAVLLWSESCYHEKAADLSFALWQAVDQ
jgi:hypothetical protein